MVNLLAQDFGCFRDEHRYEGGKMIRLMKRAQILVADLWACFNGESYGEFHDIDKITMFADYRIPQILMTMGALYCSPAVAATIKDKKMIESGCSWELQIRGKLFNMWCNISCLLNRNSLQYLVCRADSTRNYASTSWRPCQCHPYRLFPL
jgi:hypothetical protein